MNRKTAILLAAALLLSGCGKAAGEEGSSAPDSTQSTEQKKEYSAADILDRVSASGYADNMNVRAELGSEDFDGVCEKLYGVTPGSLTGGGIMFEETGQLADEVSVLKGAGEEVLRARAEQRAAVYEGYAPEEAEKARRAEVFTFEGFSVLVIADNASEIKKIITEQ